MEMSVREAFHRSIKTLSDWISREVNLSKTHVIFRGYAPVHFRCSNPPFNVSITSFSNLDTRMSVMWVVFCRGGDWKNGGSCHLETIPDFTTPPLSSENYTAYRTVVEGLSEHLRAGNVELLNVTVMTSHRKDGHSSLYYLGPKAGPAPIHRQDCSHWCLPGVPDSWNELLYASFLRRRDARENAH